MKIDLHFHTTFSYQGKIGRKESDSSINLANIPILAKQQGLDGVVITDHMTYEAGLEILNQTRQQHPKFLLLRGMEYHSDHGHMLIFGIKDDSVCERFGKYGPVEDVINYVTKQGGIVIPSHPYESGYTHVLQDNVFTLKGITALEVINGHQSKESNQKAAQAAKQMNLPGTGGSDSHWPETIGSVYTEFENRITSMKELINELKRGKYHAQQRY